METEKYIKTILKDKQGNLIMLDKTVANLITNLEKRDVLIEERIYEEINNAPIVTASDYLNVLYDNLFKWK